MAAPDLNVIHDVMSDDPNNSKSYDSDSTLLSPDDAILSSLLRESENMTSMTKSLSNLYSHQSNLEELTFVKKPWQNSGSIKSRLSSNSANIPLAMGAIGFSSGDVSHVTGLQRPVKTPSVCQSEAKTFTNTSTLLYSLQNELMKRTSELHQTENEYSSLKANFDKMSSSFDMINTDLSMQRSRNASKDKQIRQLQQKINSLEGNMDRAQQDNEQIRLELEKTRDKLEQVKNITDFKNESLSYEVRQREEIIDQLRSELTLTCRSVPRIAENENIIKEKVSQLEKTIKQKDQHIQSLQRQNIGLEKTIKELENNKELDHTGSSIKNLEEEIDFLKEQLDNSNRKNEALNETYAHAKKFYDEYKINSENAVNGNIKTIDKIKSDYKELEKKHRESVAALKQERDNNKHLANEIKDLSDKVKNSDAFQMEQEKKIQSILLENNENLQKMESLKSQLFEASITESNLLKTLNNENDCKQSSIDQLCQETIHLNRSIEDLTEKIKIRDSTIEKLNEQLVESNVAKEADLKIMKSLEEKINSVSHKEKILENDNRDKTHEMQVLELELKNTKHQYDNLVDEFRQITGEKKEIERLLKRKEDLYNKEINNKSEESQVSKSELMKLNIMMNNEKTTNERLTLENEQYLKELSGLRIKVAELTDDQGDGQTSIDEWMEKEKRLQLHNKYLEEQLVQVKLALEDSTQELDHIKNSWSYREDALESCKNEIKKQQEHNINLIQKVEQRDQLLQRLTTETTKLKQKYQEKSSKNLQLVKDNEFLQSTAGEAERSLKEWQHKFDGVVRKKDSTIEQLRQELMEAENQFSNCHETLLRKEEFLTRIQISEKDLSLKLSETQKETSRLQCDYDEMETELNMTRAKHKACQEELIHREDQVNEIKNELQLQQHDVFDLQSESVVCQQEIERWRKKYTELQNQLEQKVDEYEKLEDQMSTKDHESDELQSRLQKAKQQMENNERTIDQLKIDANLAKATNNDRCSHFQSLITSLKNEVENRSQENHLLEEKCVGYKTQMTRLKSDLDGTHQSLLSAKNETEAINERFRLKEEECQHWIQQTQTAQYLNEEVKISLDSLEKEVVFVKQQLDAKDIKLHSNADIILKLKSERNQIHKNLSDYKSQLESSTKDRDEIGKLHDENCLKMRRYEQCVKDLNEELSTAQIEICNQTNVISKLETELSHASMNYTEKQAIIEEMEIKMAKLKVNFNNYKNQYKTSEKEVENLNLILLQQTKKTAELENSLTLLKSERDKLVNGRKKIDNKMMQVQEELALKKNELDQMGMELCEKSRLADENYQKYQHEMKKLKAYGKQVEEDISMSHKNIEDLQQQLDFKQEQLQMVIMKSETAEDYLEKRNWELNQMGSKLTRLEDECQRYRSVKESDANNQLFYQREIDGLQMDLKERNNKIVEMTSECSKYQAKCSSLEIQLQKAEKKVLKYESECKSLRASFSCYNKEVTDLRSQQHNQADVLEKTRSQYEKFVQEYNTLKEENRKEKKNNSKITNEVDNLKNQLQGCYDHQKLLEEQIGEHEQLIAELQSEIIQERKKSEDFLKADYQKKRTIHHIESETESLAQTKCELQMKLKDKDSLAASRLQELEVSNQKIRQLTESVIDKDNKCKILEKRLQNSENEVFNLRKEISKSELAHNSCDLNTDRSEYVLELQSALDTSQRQIEQLCTRYRQDDKDRPNHRAQSTDEEMANLQWTIKRLKYELEEKNQMNQEKHDESTGILNQRIAQFQNDESEYQNRIRQLKNEAEYLNNQLMGLKSKNDKLYSEKNNLDTELKHSLDAIDKLKMENEAIVDNFNSWIQEQKLANEKLGEKIRDQNKSIQELRKEKSNWEKEKRKLIESLKQSNKIQIGSEVSHGSQETANLRTQLNAAEKQFQMNINEKGRIIENLQEKIREQIDEIACLKQKILLCEKHQQETKLKLEQAIQTAEGYRNGNDDQFGGSANNRNESRLLKEADNNTMNKQYWIKRVGELSEELQQCKEYWSNKVKELSTNLESSIITDETISTRSS